MEREKDSAGATAALLLKGAEQRETRAHAAEMSQVHNLSSAVPAEHM